MEHKTEKTNKLIIRFSVFFLVFSIILVAVCSVAAYYNETSTYRKLKLEEIRNVNEYLESIILHDGDDYGPYFKYLKEYHDKMDVPYDFTEYDTALEEFNLEFAKRFPDKLFNVDMFMEDLPEDMLLQYLVYDYEYWMLTFEDARDSFDLEYTYMIAPDSSTGTVTYIIDPMRDVKEDDPKMIDIYYVDAPEENPRDETRILWDTWETGKQLDEFQIWDNKYGKTYCCYTPLYLNGQKLALICTEISIDDLNKDIMKKSARLAIIIAVILIISLSFALWLVNHKHLSRLSLFSEAVKEYSATKDIAVADKVKQLAVDRTEISELAKSTSEMILELDDYMRTIVNTSKELDLSRQREAEAKSKAMQDPLTGIRNKAAYDELSGSINQRIENGFKEFGVCMVDMNYLKHINDNWGHDKGDAAIVKLSRIVCSSFKHSPVFRIGGDEFVVILMGEDYEKAEEMKGHFKDAIGKMAVDKELRDWEKVSAAIGVAKYDPDRDHSVEDVFKRADEAMYDDKSRMKAGR